MTFTPATIMGICSLFVKIHYGPMLVDVRVPLTGHQVSAAYGKREKFFPNYRKTRFLKKAGFPDLSGKNFYHLQILR
jgi:hypothetical protein